MILPDYEIRDRELIEPFNPDQLQPATYDLRIGDVERNVINPSESLLAVTNETVAIPDDLCGIVFGKSTVAREFLNIHYAGFIDPGFEGQIVLELTNNSDQPIDLNRYETICQIAFFELKGTAEKAYNGHYQNQQGITKSWLK